MIYPTVLHRIYMHQVGLLVLQLTAQVGSNNNVAATANIVRVFLLIRIN